MYCTRTSLWPALLGLLTAACATSSRPADAPERVDTLIGTIEHVHIEAESSRVAIADSFERLRVLGSGEFGANGVVAAYARFVRTIDAAEHQAKRYGAAVEAMQAAAPPVFEQWGADLSQIQSERLRQRSEIRLEVTRERYQAIANAAVPAREQFDTYVQDLRDHATFLAHDLNASALDDLREEIKLVTEAARDLDNRLDLCLGAARAYVDNSALPTTVDQGR